MLNVMFSVPRYKSVSTISVPLFVSYSPTSSLNLINFIFFLNSDLPNHYIAPKERREKEKKARTTNLKGTHEKEKKIEEREDKKDARIREN